MTWGVAIRHRRCRAQRDQVTGPTARGEGSASDEPPGGSGRSEAEPSPDPQAGSASDEPPGGSGRSEADPSPDPQNGTIVRRDTPSTPRYTATQVSTVPERAGMFERFTDRAR